MDKINDLIDRQAAIDALHMHLMYRLGTDSNKKRLDEWINNLPSVQPEKVCIAKITLSEEQVREAVEKAKSEIVQVFPSTEPEQRWIPCSDPSDLPKDKRLWITREISDGFFTLREVSDVIWDMTEWSGSVSNVVAYMPYWEPEPYTKRREE